MTGFVRSAIILLFALALQACSFSTFDPIDPGFKPKGRTLAVVAGLDNEPSVNVAESMTESLKKHTRFQVMSNKQVAQSVPGYPQPIKGPYSSAYFQIEKDYTRTDLKKVREIQQRLGVDYLYVLWVPTATTMQGTIHQLHIIAQLFEGPATREVGHGQFNATAGRVAGCCLVPPPGDAEKVNAIDQSTEYVAKELGEKTGMLK